MKTKNQPPTGPTAALKTAHDAVTQILRYSHKRLTKEYYGVNMPTLRKVGNGEPLKPVTYNFYMNLFLRLLKDEHWKRIKQGVTDRELLHVLSQILFLFYGMNLDEEDEGLKR